MILALVLPDLGCLVFGEVESVCREVCCGLSVDDTEGDVSRFWRRLAEGAAISSGSAGSFHWGPCSVARTGKRFDGPVDVAEENLCDDAVGFEVH